MADIEYYMKETENRIVLDLVMFGRNMQRCICYIDDFFGVYLGVNASS